MKISSQWLREFVDIEVPLRQLADDLTQKGTAVESASGDGDTAIFEMEITTNRVDCMNHYGVARECSAIYDLDLKAIQPKLPAVKPGEKFPIHIDDAEGCARYTAQVIRGVKIGASPERIRKRLEMLGASSISNAVDASNYTLMEMGHPTHAFDLDLLAGGKIIVRRAKAGESLKTLDGVARKLHPEDLIIADAHKPVALAGVMGGFDTMITDETRNILIESAWFDPATVRKTARRLGIHTDASHRFERGADWGATSLACARVAQLVLESAGGELSGDAVDAMAREIQRPQVQLSRPELLRILGQEIPAQQVEQILRRLGFAAKSDRTSAERRNDYLVDLPTWRMDVEREIDLIEEVARIFGFNNFKNTLPAFGGSHIDLPDEAKAAKTRSTLLALGYDEAISMTFVSAEEAARFSQANAVGIANPLSAEAAMMRTSLVPGMLTMLAHNLNRGNSDVGLFEAGNIFEMSGGKSEEHKRLCLGATGNAESGGVHQPHRPYSFFDLKGSVEALLGKFQHETIHFEPKAADYYRPGRSATATMDGAMIAQFGQISPEIAAARKIKQEIFVADIFLDQLYRRELRQPRYTPASRFPSVERDFSLVLPQEVTFDELRAAMAKLDIAEMQSFAPADMMRGKQAEKAGIPVGKYSLLLRVTFQSGERTLRDDEVAAWSERIIAGVKSIGGTLRG